jgi:hypothetical protein
MKRVLSVTILGLAASWFTLSTPATSQAQGISIKFGYGNGGYYGQPNVKFGLGYSNYGGYGYGGGYGYQPSYYGHGGHGGHGHFDDCGPYAPPVIVQPTHYHWTPSKGYHSHGNIIVPHKNHYHVYPY